MKLTKNQNIFAQYIEKNKKNRKNIFKGLCIFQSQDKTEERYRKTEICKQM